MPKSLFGASVKLAESDGQQLLTKSDHPADGIVKTKAMSPRRATVHYQPRLVSEDDMIVGCYDLHLYCRNDLPKYYDSGPVPIGYHAWDGQPDQYTGATLAEAKAASKKRGWTWQRDGDVTCPLCNRKAKG